MGERCASIWWTISLGSSRSGEDLDVVMSDEADIVGLT